MPRKHKDKDNVIPFQTTRGQPDAQQQAEDGVPIVVQKMDENRATGMKNLERRCDNFDHREMITDDKKVDENDMRNLESAIKSTYQTLEALNSLVDMLRHDLIGCIRNIEAQSVSGWQMSAHLQTLLELLRQKGVITEEEMKATWEKIIPEQVKKLQEQAQGPTDPE